MPKLSSPVRQKRAAFIPTSVSEGDRSAVICWTTGAEGERTEWDGEVYLESLRVDEASIRMGRLNNGAPVLDSHNSFELKNQIGVVEEAWIENGQGMARIRFSSRPEVEPFFKDVQAGIIRNISVGYVVYEYRRILGQDGQPDRLVAVDWEPQEISFVPVPFDAGAQVRSGDRTFTATVTVEGKPPMRKLKEIRAALAQARAAVQKAREVEDESQIADAQAQLETIEAELETALDTLDDGVGDAPNATPGTETGPAEGSELRGEGDDEEEDPEAVERGVQAERSRATQIRKFGAQFKVATDDLIKRGVTVEQAKIEILTTLQQRQANISPHVETTAVNEKKVLGGLERALLARALPSRFKLDADATRFRGFDLMDMGRQCIEMAGGRIDGLTRREIARLSLNVANPREQRAAGMHSTSDFPLILGNVIDRTLRTAYDDLPQTWQQLGRQDNVTDFRQRTIVALGDTAAFEQVREGGEYKYGSLPEEGNTYSVDKFGKIIAFTWEAMINDDLGAFNRVPQALARAARQTEDDIVWGLLLSNPTWIDGQPIYSNAHGNLAAAGGPINVQTLGAARAAMRKQKGLNGQNYINIVPRFLVVGPDRELEAQQFLSPNYMATTGDNINPFVGTLTLVVDPRIEDGSWYLIGDGADTFVYSYLEGEGGLFTETREGFEVDGVEVKARLVFGAAYVDYRSFYKNPGD